MREHGTRARYVADKCRCDACRSANRAYQASRAKKATEAASGVPPASHCACGRKLRKDSKGGVCGACREKLIARALVHAARARDHLIWLSKQGVGRRAVHAACDVSDSILQKIRSGEHTKLTPETEARILEVTPEAISDHAIVSARETLRAIGEMRLHGLTLKEIAERLGYKTNAPQFSRRGVLAKSAFKVQKLLREVREEIAEGERIGALCPACAFFHEKRHRMPVLKRKLPALDRQLTDREVEKLRHVWPLSCFYEQTEAGYMRLRRDLIELGVAGNKRRKIHATECQATRS